MCGRYTLQQAEKALNRVIPIDEWIRIWVGEWIHHRFNVSPTQKMPVVTASDGRRTPHQMRWGFVPFYARAQPKPQALINARSETILVKTPFKRAAHKQRCLVPADGFFEWKRDGDRRQPYYFTLRDEEPFAFASLFEPATDTLPAGYLLLTTRPNCLMEPVHDRMPVILQPDAYDEWLANEPLPDDRLMQLCAPYPAEEMMRRAVSPLVNSPRNDSPEVLAAFPDVPVPLPDKITPADLSGQGELPL